jgi:hypothetical protein
VDTGFRKRSCFANDLKRDDDSKKSHHALAANIALSISLPITADTQSGAAHNRLVRDMP